VSTTPKHVLLQIPRDVGVLDTVTKSVAIISVQSLGFFHSRTEKFHVRPGVTEFLFGLQREYNLAIVSHDVGRTIATGLFGVYNVLFVSEGDDLHDHLCEYQLDSTNAFIVDTSDHSDMYDIGTITVSRYSKTNNKDVELDVSSNIFRFILSISDKVNIGIHINSFNEN
jgi:hypothetical protein